MTASTDLATQGNYLVSPDKIEAARRCIPELVDTQDVEVLDDWAGKAEAVSRFHERERNREAANNAARLKIECEAAIGLIDLASCPWGPGTSNGSGQDLDLGVRTVPAATRRHWRRLGLAQAEGVLASICDGISTEDLITTAAVVSETKALGVGWVRTGPLKKRFREMVAQGISGREIGRRANVAPQHTARVLSEPRCSRPVGEKLAEAMGIDPSKLQRCPPPPRTRRAQSRLRLARSVKGGYAEVYRLIRLAEQALITEAGESGNDALWEHLHKAEDLAAAKARGGG